MWLSLYILALAALAVHAPDMLWQPQVRDFVIVLAVLGAWRYGWGAVHLSRGLWYRHVVFPRWRRAADRSGAAGPPHTSTFVIATSRVRRRDHRARLSGRDRRGDPSRPPCDHRRRRRRARGPALDQAGVSADEAAGRGPARVRAPAGQRQAPSDGLCAARRVPHASVPRCRGRPAGRRRAADCREPGAEPAFPQADARSRRHHDRRGEHRRRRSGHGGVARPSCRPAPSGHVVARPVASPAGDHRPDVDPSGRGRHPPRLHRGARTGRSRTRRLRGNSLRTGDDRPACLWLYVEADARSTCPTSGP